MAQVNRILKSKIASLKLKHFGRSFRVRKRKTIRASKWSNCCVDHFWLSCRFRSLSRSSLLLFVCFHSWKPVLMLGFQTNNTILARDARSWVEKPLNQYSEVWFSEFLLPSRLGLKNTQTALLQRGKTAHPNECPRYDTKQSDIDIAPRSTLARNGSTW